ncbi:MAG: hypothetical protein QXY45_00515 [Candidatus Aenigmatarchaeota archaeon]
MENITVNYEGKEYSVVVLEPPEGNLRGGGNCRIKCKITRTRYFT